MSIDHWMMFSTFAEQDYFRFPEKQTYSGCIINANMATHAPAGLAAFLLEKTAGIKYLIDPLTHAFQHDPSCITNSKGEIKKALKILADKYNNPFSEKAGKRPVHPRDFEDTSLFESFVMNCINFQKNQLSSAVECNDSAKYLEDLELSKTKNPYAVVAPYFYITSSTMNQWLDINVKAITIAKRLFKDEKLFCEMVIGQSILSNAKSIESLLERYSSLNVNGYLIWVDELDEHDCDPDVLVGFVELVKGLRKNSEAEILNIHGGYFSTLLSGKAGNRLLNGISHGPEFGESRAVVPVGGGIPISRYYIPKLHNRIRYREALRVLTEMGHLNTTDVFHKEVCNCTICKVVLNGDTANFPKFGDFITKSIPRSDGFVRRQFPTTESKELCLKHYLNKKVEEISFCDNADRDVALKELDDSYSLYSDVMSLNEVSHLKLWRDIITGI